MTIRPDDELPTDLEELPDEEGISSADADRRVGLDPAEQGNRTDAPDEGRDLPLGTDTDDLT